MRAAPILLALCATSACAAQRTLRVTSDPPGATIRLDDRIVGTTPARVPFDHYGIRRVTLYRDGYRSHSERVKLRAPWYGTFPLDVISEVLLPFGWRDERRLHVTLLAGEEAVELPSVTSVFERADILRSAGIEGPRDLPPPQATVLPANEEPELEPAWEELEPEPAKNEESESPDGRRGGARER